ncbi:MAG: hypothetical protein KDK56_07305 [Simkania sp.]|nr:hypothetical protein [Simkania sp.]MCP5489493.1 hypothetical protein [Chlamydiales bacterium]
MNDIILTDKSDHSYYLAFLRSLSDLNNSEFPGKFWTDEHDSQCYASYREMYKDFMSLTDAILTWAELLVLQKNNPKKLCKMLEDYEDYLPDRQKTDEEIRNDPAWDKIRKALD